MDGTFHAATLARQFFAYTRLVLESHAPFLPVTVLKEKIVVSREFPAPPTNGTRQVVSFCFDGHLAMRKL